MMLLSAFLASLVRVLCVLRFPACLVKVQKVNLLLTTPLPWAYDLASFFTTYAAGMQGFAANWIQYPFSYANESSGSVPEDIEHDADASPPESPSLIETPFKAYANETRRTSRTKTTYHIAHPAPVAHRRPKLIFQIQDDSLGSRPLPILDVLPARAVAPNFARRFPKLIRRTTGLTENDLVVVRAEDHGDMHCDISGFPSGNADLEAGRAEEPFGVICQSSNTASQGIVAEITLNDNSTWQGGKTNNGNYDFDVISGGEPFGTVRWAARPKPKKSRSNTKRGPEDGDQRDRFTFSIIDSNMRQHSVIGILERNTTQTIQIFDSYTSSNVMFNAAQEVPVDITERLRSLILLTGIWVALNEGWSTAFTPIVTKPYRMSIGAQSTDPSRTRRSSQDSIVRSQNQTLAQGRAFHSHAPSSTIVSRTSSFSADVNCSESKLISKSRQHSDPLPRSPLEGTYARNMSAGLPLMGRHSFANIQQQYPSANTTFRRFLQHSDDDGLPVKTQIGLLDQHSTQKNNSSASISRLIPFRRSRRKESKAEAGSGIQMQIEENGLEPEAKQVQGKHDHVIVSKLLRRWRTWKNTIKRHAKRLR